MYLELQPLIKLIPTCNRWKAGWEGAWWGHRGPEVHRWWVHERWRWWEAWWRWRVHTWDRWRLEGQHTRQVDILYYNRVASVVERTHVPPHAETLFWKDKRYM